MGQVLHASYSGWFPFCLSPQEPPIFEDGSTYYPLGLSVTDAMLFYWRISQYNLYANKPSVSYNKTKQIYRSPAIATEEQLVCESAYTIIANDPDFDPGGAEDDYGFSFFGDNPYRGLYYNGLVYPSIFLSFTAGSQIIKPSEISYNSSSKTITFSDINLTMSVYPNIYFSYGGTYNTSTGEPN